MIFKLHYWFLTAGANSLNLLLGVYIKEYTTANAIEIGALYLLMPFLGLIFRPIICSKADREQAHQFYLILCLFLVSIAYLPFVVIPLLGPEVYFGYPRTCWYILVILKVLGDIAIGGVVSIGDALAINYARRINTEFSVYRVWGTVSWMVFGIIIGQINEVSFLPKYVPGFMILITSTLLDVAVIWLWPREYFVMKPEIIKPIESSKSEKEDSKKENALFKSLLPRQVVIRSMRAKLLSLLTCSCFSFQDEDYSEYLDEPNATATPVSLPAIKGLDPESNDSQKIAKVDNNSCQGTREEIGLPKRDVQIHEPIDKKTQFRILIILLKRDIRIIAYLLFSVGAGFSMFPVGYILMNVEERCHEEGSCNFSQLGGLMQFSMAAFETVMLIYIKQIQAVIGRVNTGALAFFLYSIKITYISFFWMEADPYYMALVEGFRGAAFGIYVTMLAELGYKFANEVQFIIPELKERGYITDDADTEHLKLSLSSTMQSLMASSMDGIGRGLGALICGSILNYHTYHVLWKVIAYILYMMLAIILTISICDNVFKFELGLDLRAELEAKRRLKMQQVDELKQKDNVSEKATV